MARWQYLGLVDPLFPSVVPPTIDKWAGETPDINRINPTTSAAVMAGALAFVPVFTSIPDVKTYQPPRQVINRQYDYLAFVPLLTTTVTPVSTGSNLDVEQAFGNERDWQYQALSEPVFVPTTPPSTTPLPDVPDFQPSRIIAARQYQSLADPILPDPSNASIATDAAISIGQPFATNRGWQYQALASPVFVPSVAPTLVPIPDVENLQPSKVVTAQQYQSLSTSPIPVVSPIPSVPAHQPSRVLPRAQFYNTDILQGLPAQGLSRLPLVENMIPSQRIVRQQPVTQAFVPVVTATTFTPIPSVSEVQPSRVARPATSRDSFAFLQVQVPFLPAVPDFQPSRVALSVQVGQSAFVPVVAPSIAPMLWSGIAQLPTRPMPRVPYSQISVEPLPRVPFVPDASPLQPSRVVLATRADLVTLTRVSTLFQEAPTLVPSSTVPTVLSVNWIIAVGGTPPYTYDVQRAYDVGFTQGLVTVAAGITHTFTTDSVEVGYSYYYRVIAHDSAGNTAVSAPTGPYTPPGTLIIVSSRGSGDVIRITGSGDIIRIGGSGDNVRKSGGSA